MFLDIFKKKAVKETFKWRDREGNFISFSEVPTKRLFYTANMIWNHSQPEELQIWYNHKYEFGPFYTSSYMLEAFKEAVKELSKRTDIGPRMLGVVLFW